jgi:hypothetical protein
MVQQYKLKDFYTIMNSSNPYIFQDEFYSFLNSIDEKVIPIINSDKQDNYSSSNYNRKSDYTKRHSSSSSSSKKSNHHATSNQNWEEVRTVFKPTTIEKSNEEGIDKWMQDIRTSINKITTKKYDVQVQNIMESLKKCMEMEGVDESQRNDNLKLIANFIFNIASSNKFYAELYANLYGELIHSYSIFQEVLQSFLSTYVNSIKEIQYVEPEVNYEGYCQYIKQNDVRKATALFITSLVKLKVIPVIRLLNIMVAFQDISKQYMEEENRVNEVDEITEILFLFLHEGKTIFQDCKGEWIWKFVILPNIDTVSKYKKGDKKSLSTRTIFKYMDMIGEIGE